MKYLRPETVRQAHPSSENGMIIVAVISIIIFLGVIMTGMFGLAASNLSRAKGRIYSLQAQYAAESGVDAAIATFNGGNDSYTGTTSEIQVLDASNYKATYTVAVTAGSNNKEKILTAIGRVYTPKSAVTPKNKKTIRVAAQRNTTSTASSLVSRNILAMDSGVKNLVAKDINVNGFITMDKNTTNLIAENIIVAGKNTGAANCSIGGIGNLIKPISFTTPGQTKTNLVMAYNNCISPPGNNSNTSFEVSANQGAIGTVQSTYIPWNQYMDNGYTASSNGCNDWTTGGATRDIPSTSASKKTHYPDSGSNVSSSCGSSGDISLGSNRFNLKDHAHVRANFCTASPCTPTFYNPDAALKFLFIEGTVNFGSVQTAAGSGPIVIIAYGADPSSKTSVCPYGGSIYIANTGDTSAAALYLLSTNGVCLDKTKFAVSPALGGIGGKNIYIATNPGTPFDLKLDPAFPVNQIPIDLTWRAVRYQSL